MNWPAAFIVLSAGALILFTLAPGSLEGKSLAVLHGLCAQQPTHSFYFDEARLPFDARMTGIYGGFAFTGLYLTLRRRWKRAAVPSVPVILLLVALIAPLAVDGTNSLLKDVGLPYLYEPRNIGRAMTGLMLGTTLASFIWLLIGQTAFRPTSVSQEPIWSNAGEVLVVVVIQAVGGATLALSSLPIRLPLTYLLMISATAVVTGLLLPFVLLVTRCEGRARRTRELAQPATIALAAALILIGTMAGGRFLLEVAAGLPAQPPA